ncbi:hypothetical protein [Telmatospirillum sp. J64-1]|uniref:hypothetical protein n=1 Tax=Telmatospirillum sp. J64-1 TaxID=2502183 RepID=UPI00163DACDA|nr:hypothetical protein [Telmatospirillum sp. J64-1]
MTTDLVLMLVIWVAVLALAVPYVNRKRHPDHQPFAAWMIFASVFTIAAAVIYAVLSAILVLTGASNILRMGAGTILFLGLVFVPAFFAARLMILKKPGKAPHTRPPG